MVKRSSSYHQIVKSTSIFGGTQVVNIIIGIIRTKVIAILLGAVGVGLIGIYQSIIDVVRSLSGLGIETGGIKSIASSIDNDNKLVHRIAVFRWWVKSTAILGSLICIIFCYPISLWAFHDSSYTLAIAILSISVFFTTLSLGQSVVIQGLRKISYLAKSSLFGNLLGLVISLTFYYFWGLKGILPAFISGSLILLFFTSYYQRKIKLPTIPAITTNEAYREGLVVIKLGLFIVLAGIINTASMFFIRAFINDQSDLIAAGIFQSAWAITNMYLMLVLRSMGSDFFPRLCNIANNKDETKNLLNEQTYIVLVVATPIIIIMFMFADHVLSILYSSEFIGANHLLRWQVVGTFFKVLSWPLGFLVLAQGKGKYFLLAEASFFCVYLLISYFSFPYYGLDGIGFAYLLAYIIYLLIVFCIGKYLVGFAWMRDNRNMCIFALLLIAVAVFIVVFHSEYIVFGGILLGAISIIYSLFKLNKVFDIMVLINKLRK